MSEEKSFSNSHINWYPGHMLKTKKQIIEDLKLIDVVVEILDARIPVSSQNPDIKKLIQNKKRIVVLNKSDLANTDETKKWIQYFAKQDVIAIEMDSNLGKGVKQCLNSIQNILKDEIEKAANKGRIKKNIRVLIVGIPNVGKSSFINRMCNRKTAIVGNKPGVTKQKQWVRIANNIELLDTPGVLWPKFEDETVALNLSYTGTIKDELLDKARISYSLLQKLYTEDQKDLIARYKITKEELDNIDEEEDLILALMEMIAKKRGAIIAGGEVDYEKVGSLILNDFRNAKIGKITLEKVNG